MKTINVKILPQTNTKPTRLHVWTEGAKPVIRSVPFDAKDLNEAITRVVYDFKMSLGWTCKMYGGHTKDGMVFVIADDKYVIE
jgi:hypothetical protein